MTCENWRHAGAFLYEGITAEMEEQEKTMFDQFVGVNEAVIMRSATQPSDELAMQDATHTVIEGIGIKPDLLVDPLTEDEVREMALSPFTHIDRTLKQAIEVLSNN